MQRVLLVDDSISVRKFVGRMLERAGFAVTTANDGAEALAGGEHPGGVARGAAADDDDVVGRGHERILR